ncbi:MAG TPA: energy transducer TonB [Novimethylophilus sp.]|jgi:protein TonB|uniref:energy transducer TonB n=1 Tax=Novimethylophilus sp. TaxID=2137426 RepID=UPI002F42B951
MAPRSETRQHGRVNVMLMAALLFSLGLHMVVLAVLPGMPTDQNKTPVQLSVELQPPPNPLPPLEPPKPPESEKPRQPPKKPLPQPKPKPFPAPLPHAETPPTLVHAPEPQPAPPVSSAAPPSVTPPPTFSAPPLPEPPKPRGPSEQEIENARGNYGNLLSREFAKHKQYPRIAQIRGWQGSVKVELHIDANGGITSINISESSGFEVLDKQALEMVRKTLPLPQSPEALRDRQFTIIVPIAFRLE